MATGDQRYCDCAKNPGQVLLSDDLITHKDCGKMIGPMPHEIKAREFERELESLINRYSQENGSNTPDYILAEYMGSCLRAYNLAVRLRDTWYGIDPSPGWRKPAAGGGSPGYEK